MKMGFWEKFKEFDKMMSEPALIIRTEKRIEVPNMQFSSDDKEMRDLIEENSKLRKQLKDKRIKAIDTDYKLLE